MSGPDVLVWTQRKKGEANWRARNHADDATYVVYVLEACGPPGQIEGVLRRDDQPGLKSTQLYVSAVGFGSAAEAKDACQEHHYAACRAARWAKYMRDNEPADLGKATQ